MEGWEAIGVYTVESEVWMNGTVGDRGPRGVWRYEVREWRERKEEMEEGKW